MSFHVIRAADVSPQPWKNGMGVTREIARFPARAGSEDFSWRISVAEVNSASPFSTFPGIDRQIVLLDGEGFHMTLDGSSTHALTTPYAPFAFPGEAQVEVAMAGGATRDFNLMVRRAWGSGSVRVLRESGSHVPDPECVLVYVARGTVTTIDGDLEAGDAWLPDCSPFEMAEGSVVLLALAAAG
ncbi:HutD family protein [Dyella solisilvae]|uniref:HutD family protein n=1 Tax=Dyella solisilvae TaxID=1920168 RepID=A0A370K3K4_9GAMM|nr:HutD family protein [Dyella solisilvae]RDI97246.1 HutD family protein [Dyella solisilvae]